MPRPLDLSRRSRFAPSLLTDDQLRRLRSRLTDSLVEHRCHLQESEALASALVDEGADRGPGGELARVERFADHTRQAVLDVEQALACFDDGSYGACRTCRRPIPFERLEARPQARCCIGCQSPGGTSSEAPQLERVGPQHVVAARRSATEGRRRPVAR